MELSIKKISEGAPFMADFRKVKVERCHYINVFDERIEATSILSQATATIFRVTTNGTIFVQITKQGIEPKSLVQFKTTTAFYHKDGQVEVSQTAMVRGDEIIEEVPINLIDFEHGKVKLFFISIQDGKAMATIILNPPSTNDYYYRILFRE